MGDIAHEVASKVAGLAPEPLPPQLEDHAKRILESDSRLSNYDRATAWDLFYRTPSLPEFEQKIRALVLPAGTERALIAAKRDALIPQSAKPVHRALDALKKIPTDTLELAEKYPNVAKSLIDAAKSDNR